MATVFVGGINRKATPALLLKFFEDNFGSTSDCKIIMDRDTGSSKGYGFVTFKTEKAANHVVSNGFVFFMGKRVRKLLISRIQYQVDGDALKNL